MVIVLLPYFSRYWRTDVRIIIITNVRSNKTNFSWHSYSKFTIFALESVKTKPTCNVALALKVFNSSLEHQTVYPPDIELL